MLGQSDCDLATALEIYLNASPEPGDLDIVPAEKPADNWEAKFPRSHILRRVRDGSYPNRIQFGSSDALKRNNHELQPHLALVAKLASESEGKQIVPRAWWGNGLPDLNLS